MYRTALSSALISISLLFNQLAWAEGVDEAAWLQARNDWALVEAIMENDVPQVRFLLDDGANPNTIDIDYGWNAISATGRYWGNAEVMEMLKQSGADLDAPNRSGWNVLHLAIQHGADYSPEFYQFLFDNNFPLDEPIQSDDGYQGVTPLILTVVSGNARVAKLLLENGADPNLTWQGKTAVETAREYNKSAMLTALQAVELKRVKVEQAQAAEQEMTERQARRLERDSKLPLAVRKDKYMIALTDNLKAENYQESLAYFELLESLQVELPDSFYYFWGEALFKSGQAEASLDKLYAYIGATGVDGEYYREALSLSNKAEEAL